MTVIPRVYGILFFLEDYKTSLVMEVGDKITISPKKILIFDDLID